MYGHQQVDILVHSLANGPEVTKPLLETSRRGYLAASSASAYSMVSLVQRFGPIMPKGGTVVSLTYIASEKVGTPSRLKPAMRMIRFFCLFSLPAAKCVAALLVPVVIYQVRNSSEEPPCFLFLSHSNIYRHA